MEEEESKKEQKSEIQGKYKIDKKEENISSRRD